MPGDVNTPREVLLVGAGPMARAYAQVLKELGVVPTVVGRSETGVASFHSETGMEAVPGGIERWLTSHDAPSHAIVATSVDGLADTSHALLRAGVSALLIEKPGALDLAGTERLARSVEEAGAAAWVAYNRRFLASVAAAAQLIAEDGGVRSFTFDFTEQGDRVAQTHHPDHVKHAWLLANSSHVIDLAFWLGGRPVHLHPQVAGHLDWADSPRVYVGAGRTDVGASFSYHANWGSPGGWSVTLATDVHRVLLQPLERLRVQRLGSFEVEDVEVEDAADERWKPGLLRQTEAFLRGAEDGPLKSVGEQVRFVRDVIDPLRGG
jgi:predicted dehydrogenase